MTEIGALIRERRTQAGISQMDLARLLPGFSRGAVNNLENGATKTISAEVANELVKILPVTMAELLRAMGYELPGPRGTSVPGLILKW